MSELVPGARIDGIDAPLPPGEHVRWQGAPMWRSLAWRAFHGRTVLLYFTILCLWQGGAVLTGGKTLQAALGIIILLVILAVISLACSALLGWLTARNSVYAITDRRVVLRIGAIVPSIINIPYRMIDSVAVTKYGHDQGDLAIALAGTDRIAFFQLWPHARPWHVKQPQPMLRSLRDPMAVGKILREAVADFSGPGALSSPEVAPQTAAATSGAAHHSRPAIAH
jgi:hypothetical protein